MKRCLYGALFLCFAMTAVADDSGHNMRHRSVRAFDANGQVVGDLTIFGALNGVAFTVGNGTTVVPIERVQDTSRRFSATDFRWLAAVGASFASSDCTGDPILDSTNGPHATFALRRGNVVTLYSAVEGVQQIFTANSFLDATAGCRPLPGLSVEGWAVGRSRVINDEHPEPLRVGY
jgi:hypothetical protein